MELYCYRHPHKKAVAIVNGKYPVCKDCADDATVAILNAGEMLGIAIRGVPQALIIPQEASVISQN